ncbi:putative membrane protein [Tenacibaculum litopenaei]|uniref:phage holin family protein n=1 Tax=Tenacibaculum litopenaei TaxID=396016 RepID=UPI0038965053
MKLLLKLILTSVAVLVLAKLLPGVVVTDYLTAFFVAVTLALLNTFVRPILIFFTLPATIVTLGFFLLVINALIVMLAGSLVSGFAVSGFFTAFVFSFMLWIFRSILFSLIKEEETK